MNKKIAIFNKGTSQIMNEEIFNQPNTFEKQEKKKEKLRCQIVLPVTQTVTLFEPK